MEITDANPHKEPAFEIGKTLSHLGPLERGIRHTRMGFPDNLNSMDLLLGRKPLGIQRRVGEKDDKWNKNNKSQHGADNVKPLPRREITCQVP